MGHKNKAKRSYRNKDNRKSTSAEEPAKKVEETPTPEVAEERKIEKILMAPTSALSAGDQANVDNVFSTLEVITDETVELDVAEEENNPASENDVENDVENVVEDAGEDLIDGANEEKREEVKEKIDEPENKEFDSASEISVEQFPKEQQQQHQVVTKFKFERRDQDIQFHRFVFNTIYGSTFAGFLNFVDPECRYAAGVGPAETFDAEGVQKLVEKMKEAGDENVWPFEQKLNLEREDQEKMFQQLSIDIHTIIKLCLMLACAERGYELSSAKRNEREISNVWAKKLDPLVELKTVLAIVNELEKVLPKIGLSPPENTRFWIDMKNYSEVVLPALESFDSKLLAEHSIIDCTATIHGRKELGFEISEEDVDDMLESMVDNEFCDFVPTALHHPRVFTTVKQLKLIHAQLEKMSKIVDIRVKQSGIQAITHIFKVLSRDVAMEVLEEMKDSEKLPLKIFGIELDKFDSTFRGVDPKRANYFKLFTVALNKSEFFTVNICTAALLCAYLCCPAFEVNLMIYKILGTRIPTSAMFKSDKELLIKTLLSLPFQLREQLQIGPEFSLGEVTENQDSMYFQIKSALRGRIECDFIDRLDCFLSIPTGKDRLVSIDRVMHMFIKCVENGECQKMSVQCLNLLRREHYLRSQLPKELFEDLLILALSKYSVPDGKAQEAKYKFLEDVFRIVRDFQKKGQLQIDIEKTRERWNNLNHFWFSILYLSARFSVLKDIAPKISYPWASNEIWDDDKTAAAEDHTKKYGVLARVSTAWPECTDIRYVESIVKDHVPQEVERVDLYEEILKCVMDLNSLDDFTKSRLVSNYKEKILRLKKEASTEKARKEEEKVTVVENESTEKARNGKEVTLVENESTEKARNGKEVTLVENEAWFKTELAEDVWSALPKHIQHAVEARRAEKADKEELKTE